MTERPIVARAVRAFEQAPERVFDAFLDPERAGRFLFATAHGRMVKVEIDARVGGRYTFVDRRDGVDVEHTGEYLEIARPTKLVFTLKVPMYGSDVDRVQIDIAPRGKGCELTLTHQMGAEHAAYRERTEQGWGQILDAAATLLGAEPEQAERGAAELEGGRTSHRPSRAVSTAPGGFAWRFERTVAAPPQQVFDALIEPVQLARWFPFEIQGRREPGARLRFVLPSGEMPPEDGVLSELVPPERVAYTWGDQKFDWQVLEAPGGSRVVLTNTFVPALKNERDREGWDHCEVALDAQLDALAQYLAGEGAASP